MKLRVLVVTLSLSLRSTSSHSVENQNSVVKHERELAPLMPLTLFPVLEPKFGSSCRVSDDLVGDNMGRVRNFTYSCTNLNNKNAPIGKFTSIQTGPPGLGNPVTTAENLTCYVMAEDDMNVAFFDYGGVDNAQDPISCFVEQNGNRCNSCTPCNVCPANSTSCQGLTADCDNVNAELTTTECIAIFDVLDTFESSAFGQRGWITAISKTTMVAGLITMMLSCL